MRSIMRSIARLLLGSSLVLFAVQAASAQVGKNGVQPDGCAAFASNTLGSTGVPCGGSGAPGGSPYSFQYNNAGSFGGVNITGFVLGIGAGLPRAAIPSDILSLLATPGGITTYLRADGSWATPAGGGSITSVNGQTGPTVTITPANIAAFPADGTTLLPHAQLPALVSGDIPNNGASTTGNAATATTVPAGGVTGNLPSTQVSGLAPSATIDATNAANLASGTIAPPRLPAATIATQGAVTASTNLSHVCTLWGDSIAAGTQDGTGVTLQTLLQAQAINCSAVINRGVSGQTSRQIAVRAGVKATTATVTIPATTTPATITFPVGFEPVTGGSVYPNSGQPTVNATISGVTGTIAWNGTTTVFTRTIAGSAVTATAAAMTVNVGNDLGGLNIIEGGINDRATPASVADSDAAFWTGVPQAPKRIIYLSILDVDMVSDWTGGANATNITTINTNRATLYPSNYVDIRTPMIAAYNSALPQDVIDHGHGIVPNSLRAFRVGAGTYALLAAMTDTTSCPSVTAGFAQAAFTLLIDQERIYVAASDGTTISSCTRGYATTTAVTHLISAPTAYWDGTHISGPGGDALVVQTLTPALIADDPGPGAASSTLALATTPRFATPPTYGQTQPAPVYSNYMTAGAGPNALPYFVMTAATPYLITNGGSGYGSAPTVTFSNNAAGTAVLTGGVVSSITMSAYGVPSTTFPTITFSGGSPTLPALATAIAAPASLTSLSHIVLASSANQYIFGGATYYRTAAGVGTAYLTASASGAYVAVGGSGLAPAVTNIQNLGSASLRFATSYTSGIDNAGTINLRDSTGANNVACTVTTGTSNLLCGGNIAPATNQSNDLGRSTLFWKNVYIAQLVSTVGTAIASAATIAPSAGVTHITGTAAVNTITATCAVAATACTITLIPDGAFTTTTAGNIALASAPVVSRALMMTWDVTAAKWYPSY